MIEPAIAPHIEAKFSSAHVSDSDADSCTNGSYLVRLMVRPRSGIRDPQGDAIASALRDLTGNNESTIKGATTINGTERHSIASVRVGKVMDLELVASSAEVARSEAERFCKTLLANPVSEVWEILDVSQQSLLKVVDDAGMVNDDAGN